MRIKPTKNRGKVLMEVGARDLPLLSEDSQLRVQKILAPLDFSESSYKGLRYAFAFAKQFHAEVLVLHVSEIPMWPTEGGIAISEGLIEDMQRESKERMSGVISEARRRKLPARTLARTGAPYHEIVEAAREEEVDLVVLSTHGRTGFKRLLLGSTAERVVRYAPCPVVVVRDKERELIGEQPQEPTRLRRERRTRAPMPMATLPP
jgi:universal stress protein A